VVYLGVIVPRYGIRLNGGERGQTLEALFAFSLPLVPHFALMWFINSGERFFIVHLSGLAENGRYSAAYTIVTAMRLLYTPIAFVAFPIMVRRWESGARGHAAALVTESMRWFTFFALPAIAVLAAVGPELLLLMSSRSFEVSATVFLLLGIGNFLFGLEQISVQTLFLLKKTYLATKLALVAALFHAALCAVLVSHFSIVGAALATVLTYGIHCLLVGFSVRSVLEVSVNWSFVLRAVVSAFALFWGLQMWGSATGIVELLTEMFCGGCAYLLLMGLTRAVTKADLLRVHELVSERRVPPS
ncbi:MAG: polysaccharide biosynthesis C-terminal domain-containing protein, partial [Bdellovibrionales bacterium]|nr:polysaccharide biosynthesis C-terminal domain-containing protein [Bdellovibrionales bacterium]